MRTLRAAYGGRCPSCGEGIRIGETIARVDRGQPWIHEACARRPRPQLELVDDDGSSWERAAAAAERRQMDQEYAAGVEDARRERFNRDMFGEEYAAAEEYARDLRGLNGDW